MKAGELTKVHKSINERGLNTRILLCGDKLIAMDGQFDDVDNVRITKEVNPNPNPGEVISVSAPLKKPEVVSIISSMVENEAIKGTELAGDWNIQEDDADFSFDALESMLMNDGSYTGGAKGSMGASDFGKKINLSSRVQNDITRSEKKGEKRVNDCGRDDRATSEQVLDPRTRLILFKLLNNGFLSAIDGCLSTGKVKSESQTGGETELIYIVSKPSNYLCI